VEGRRMNTVTSLEQRAQAELESQTRTAPEPQGGNEHPLSRFIEISTDPKPPRWIVPHVITAGITIIAGGHGTGKTTAIVPLALAVAGVCARDYELAPQYWRHVVYVAEDVEQVERIIAGCVRDLCLNMDQIRERFHLVPACRMPAVDVVGVGAQYAERFTRTITTHGGDLSEAVTVELPPLVVFDTLPATIHLDDENSNAEASAAIAAIKQRFADLPAWLIGHVSKAALSKRDTATLRGASAWEADANQVIYLTAEDDGSRWMILGKRRFEATHVEFQIESRVVDSCAADEFGTMVAVRMRYGIVRPCEGRQAQREEAAERQRQSDDAELRGAILDAVERAYKEGIPLSKSAVSGWIRRNKAETSKTVQLLLEDCWLYAIEVPKAQRVNPSKSSFLIRLTPAERDAMLTTGTVPERAIPPSWTRADFGNEPEQAGENEPVQPHDPAGQSPDSGRSESARSPKEKTPGTSGAGLEAPARAVPFPPVPESSRNEPERAGTSDSIEAFDL